MTTPLESRIDELIELNLFTTDNLVVSSGGDRDQLKQAANVWSERITSIQQQDPETVLAELRRTYHEKLEQLWSLSTQEDDIKREREGAVISLRAAGRKVSWTEDVDEMWFVSERDSDEPDYEAIAFLRSFETRLLPIADTVEALLQGLDWITNRMVQSDVDKLKQGEDIEQVVERRCHQQYLAQKEERITSLQSQLTVINEARQQALVLELDRERALQQMMNQPPKPGTKD